MIGLHTLSDRNLIVTGYTGPHQWMIARRAAERMKMPFVNAELMLEERAGTTRETVKATYGEARLKTLEAETVQELLLYRGTVILISASMLSGEHLTRLQANGTVLCLTATLDCALQRLHLSLGARYHDPRERAMALGMLKREWAIRDRDGVIALDTTSMPEAQVTDCIVGLWESLVMEYTKV